MLESQFNTVIQDANNDKKLAAVGNMRDKHTRRNSNKSLLLSKE